MLPLRQGHAGGRVLPNPNVRRRRSIGAEPGSRAARPRLNRQFGNANAFTGRRRASGQAHRARPGNRRAANEIFLARPRHREPLDASKFDGVLEKCPHTLPGWSSRGRQGDHDDRYFSESRNGKRGARWRGDHAFCMAKGADDRTGHGDHAPSCLPTRRLPRRFAIHAGQERARLFNAITIDSDTSTSDTLLLFATGAQPNVAPKIVTHDRARAI